MGSKTQTIPVAALSLICAALLGCRERGPDLVDAIVAKANQAMDVANDSLETAKTVVVQQINFVSNLTDRIEAMNRMAVESLSRRSMSIDPFPRTYELAYLRAKTNEAGHYQVEMLHKEGVWCKWDACTNREDMVAHMNFLVKSYIRPRLATNGFGVVIP